MLGLFSHTVIDLGEEKLAVGQKMLLEDWDRRMYVGCVPTPRSISTCQWGWTWSTRRRAIPKVSSNSSTSTLILLIEYL